MEVSVEEMEKLVSELEQAKKDKETLYNIALKIMDLMGILDPETKQVKADIKSGEESPFPSILKSLADVMALLMKAQAPKWMGGKDAEKAIAEKFSFVSELIPLIEKYGKQ